MVVPFRPVPQGDIDYPVSDGVPMADDGKQADWMVSLGYNLRAVFHDRDDVLIGINQFWYPLEGEADIKVAPDVYVVIGRPRGTRSSYFQWLENYVPPTVIFEIHSPSNTEKEMRKKFEFYDEYGVSEYYYIDPHENRAEGYVRGIGTLVRVRRLDGFISPSLNIRFERGREQWLVRHPDGRIFDHGEESERERRAGIEREKQARYAREAAELLTRLEHQARVSADQARAKAEHDADAERQARVWADEARAIAEQQAEGERQAREAAEQQADAERQAREAAEQQADAERLARQQAEQQANAQRQRTARIAELVTKLLAGKATIDDTAELQQLTAE